MWDEYISKLNFTALCIIKPKVMVFFVKNTITFGFMIHKAVKLSLEMYWSNETEGYVNEAYTFFFFRDFGLLSLLIRFYYIYK